MASKLCLCILKVVVEVLVAQLCQILCNPMDCSQQAPLSMGFPRQKYCNRLPFSSPGYLPNPGIEPGSSIMAGRFFTN